MASAQTSADESTSESIEEGLGELPGVGATPMASEDQGNLTLLVVRDVALVSALLSIFGAGTVWASLSGAALASLVSVVNGLVVGAAAGAVAHEWGHFAGARLAGGHAPTRPLGGIFPIFDFDYANNAKRAFDWMSIGGNLAHGAVVVLFLVALPMDSAAYAALVAGAMGFAVFSSVIEIPVIRRSRAGASPLEALGSIPKDFVTRSLPWALGSALVTFLVL